MGAGLNRDRPLIQKDIRETDDLLDRGYAELGAHSGETSDLKALCAEFRALLERTREIADSPAENSRRVASLVEGYTEESASIAAATTQMSRTTDEVARTASHLQQLSQSLQQQAGVFRVQRIG